MIKLLKRLKSKSPLSQSEVIYLVQNLVYGPPANIYISI